MDADAKQQIVDRLKQANNILVTVRTDPTIDLLSACIGLSLVLDKVGKHATAVFSGEVPSAMEFLKPEETLEQTPNRLRDFIISLDKSKADKLRYKVEDKVVRIFITPFKTELTQDDLEFSQGDFNVDLVVALGVHEQAELDSAIAEHGRILHDATVVCINNTPSGNLGSLNWQDTGASSVSEMVADLADTLDQTVFDEQVSTSLLTGVVAETARFSNNKTSPKTMNIAGKLMAAGANQQLVADKLRGETKDASSVAEVDKPAGDEHGTLEIEHQDSADAADGSEMPADEAKEGEESKSETPETTAEPEPEAKPEREMLPTPELGNAPETDAKLIDNPFTGEFAEAETAGDSHAYLIDQAAETAAGAKPAGDGDTEPTDSLSPSVDLPPVAAQAATPILKHDQSVIAPLPDDATSFTPPTSVTDAPLPDMPTAAPAADAPLNDVAVPTLPPIAPAAPAQDTLADIEKSVESPHLEADAPPSQDDNVRAGAQRVDAAREQVTAALRGMPEAPKPLESIGSHPFGEPLHDDAVAAPAAEVAEPPAVDIQVDNEGNLVSASPDAAAASPQAPPAMDLPLPPVMPSGLTDAPVASSSPMAAPGSPPPFLPPMSPAA